MWQPSLTFFSPSSDELWFSGAWVCCEAGVLLPSVLTLSEKTTVFFGQIWTTNLVPLEKKKLIAKDIPKPLQMFCSRFYFCKISSNFSSTSYEFSFSIAILCLPYVYLDLSWITTLVSSDVLIHVVRNWDVPFSEYFWNGLNYTGHNCSCGSARSLLLFHRSINVETLYWDVNLRNCFSYLRVCFYKLSRSFWEKAFLKKVIFTSTRETGNS